MVKKDNFRYLVQNINGMVDWTVPAKGKIGEKVFFFCGADSNNRLGRVIKELERRGDQNSADQVKQMIRPLYKQYDGNIIA